MKAFGLISPSRVLLADDGRFQHGLVRDERGLDLERRHPHAADLEHVVGAPAVIVVAVGVAHDICRRCRSIRRRRCGGSWRAGSSSLRRPKARARSARRSRRRPSSRPFSSTIFALIAGNRLAGRCHSGCRPAGCCRKVCSISVEPMPSRTSTPTRCAPALADMRGQRLAGRDAKAQPVGAGAAADVVVREQRGVERGHAVEDRRPVPAHDSNTRVGRRPVRPQHGGGADRHRERHGVAEAIGEEQLGRREHHVVLADAEHAPADTAARSPSGWYGRA